jgi:hypothetical protein
MRSWYGTVQRSIVQSDSGRRLNFVESKPPPLKIARVEHPNLLLSEICSYADRLGELEFVEAMKTETFVHRSRIAASAAEVYDWHAMPGALEKLTPP